MIADFSELVIETQRRTGVPGLVNKADMLVRMAEVQIVKTLRVRKMEGEFTHTVSADPLVIPIPSDYLATRELYQGDEKTPLDKLTLQEFKCGSRGYCLDGTNFIVRVEDDYTLYYYKALLGLSENNTNWLLDDEPEIYLIALSMQAYSDAGNFEAAQGAAAYLGTLIEAANRQSNTGRFAGSKIQRRR